MGLRGPVAGIQPFAEISRRATTVVYKGYDSSLERFVLLKVLRPEYSVHEDIASRFRSEARLLARVSHPNVVAVYAYGEDDGVTYMTTEFVDGQTLDELLTNGPPPPVLAAAIMLRVARGLTAAHAEGVLHRDLKPGNILISEKGQVKLTDFGLAVSEDARVDAPAIAGTLSYMAPEVVGGDPPAAPSDLFAAGTVLFELLTAQKAFPGASESEVLDGILNRSPMHGVESFSDAPSGLLVICNRLLQKDPAKRMQSAAELAETLDAWLATAGPSAGESDIATYLADPDAWSPPSPESKPTVEDHSAELVDRTSAEPTPRPSRGLMWVAAAVVAIAALWLWLLASPDTEPVAGVVSDSTVIPVPSEEAQPDTDELVAESDSLPPAERSSPGPVGSESGDDEEPEPVDTSDIVSVTDEDSARVVSEPDTADAAATGVGRLVVAFSPWASVWIDGDSLTTTSVDTLDVPAGRHQVSLRNPDFPELIRNVQIRANEVTRLELSLWSTVARLSITVIPWAAVEIDGAVVDTIPPQVRPLILAPGPHTLRLLHPEYGEIQRDIVLQAGEHRELAYNMKDASRR